MSATELEEELAELSRYRRTRSLYNILNNHCQEEEKKFEEVRKFQTVFEIKKLKESIEKAKSSIKKIESDLGGNTMSVSQLDEAIKQKRLEIAASVEEITKDVKSKLE